jgi:hypothetical protein
MTNEKSALGPRICQGFLVKRAISLQFAKMHAHLGELQACHLSFVIKRASSEFNG